MKKEFKLTPKQEEAYKLLTSDALHIMLYGGSRSGKTFLFVWAIVWRSLKVPKSRHAIVRFRFNHIKASIIYDTFPKVMEVCFPKVPYTMNKSDWFVEFPNKSQIWFGGLDEKLRTEKILGQEYSTIYLNECSQIPYSSRNLAMTRLAQNVGLPLKLYYDCNPPSKAHWTYKLFIEHIDPDSRQALSEPGRFASLRVNPSDNQQNLVQAYIRSLEDLPSRSKTRFLKGEFADATQNSLWSSEEIDKNRILNGKVPDFQRVIVGVDPSGSGEDDDEELKARDEVGIIVGGLGIDGEAYILEDLSIRTSPAKWGKIVASAFERHQADCVVAEINYGGAMVKFVIETAKPGIPFREAKAARGKMVRAEPVSSLAEKGKVHLVGFFPELEDELCAFSTTGYTGEGSPNRADAMIWVISELFPGLTRNEPKKLMTEKSLRPTVNVLGWMST